MKNFGKKLLNVTFALVLLGIGIKALMHFISKLDSEEEEYREPYQPEK